MSTETTRDAADLVSILKTDLGILVAACTSYLPHGASPEVGEAFERLLEVFDEAHGTGGEAPAPEPPGRYGRVEIPGYRENEGWISEETRFGLQVAVVRDREGTETAAIGIGPLCRVVWLPVPVPRPEPRAALPAGGPAWAGQGDDDPDDEDEPYDASPGWPG
jgi:hypothetical protein